MTAWLARDRARRDPGEHDAWIRDGLVPWVAAAFAFAKLTERQHEVIALGSLELKQREIAARLRVEPNAIEKHVIPILERTGCARFEQVVEPLATRVTATIEAARPRADDQLDRAHRLTPSTGNPV